MELKCTKMEGCGNDFIVVDYEAVKGLELSKLTIELCDRNFGVGADGAIFVKQNPLEFIYYNSDGSFSSFCGNGMRCFAKYVVTNQIVDENEFDVICKDWIVHCEVFKDEVSVQIPEISSEMTKDGEIISVCGSKHKVVEVENLGSLEELQSDDYNLNYVEWKNESEIKIKTMERGAGLTLACGSGSIASAWKMHKNKKCLEKILVKNPGGIVKIDLKNKKMRGPARIIFECRIDENAYTSNESA